MFSHITVELLRFYHKGVPDNQVSFLKFNIDINSCLLSFLIYLAYKNKNRSLNSVNTLTSNNFYDSVWVRSEMRSQETNS